MRFATYNVMSGGYATYDDAAPSPERMALLAQAVRAVEADVVGLTDTFRWSGELSHETLAETFGYPYTFHADMDDTRVDRRVGVAVLSRVPLLEPTAVRIHNRSAIRAGISHADLGGAADVVVAYLDDLDEETRILQARGILSHLAPGAPAVLMGDLNAVWPRHVAHVRDKVDAFVEAHPDFRERRDFGSYVEPALTSLYRAEVLPLLARHGFYEPSPDYLPTAFTSLHPWSMPPTFPVDHVLSRDVGTEQAPYHRHTGPLFERASDHYPLSRDLSVEQS